MSHEVWNWMTIHWDQTFIQLMSWRLQNNGQNIFVGVFVIFYKLFSHHKY